MAVIVVLVSTAFSLMLLETFSPTAFNLSMLFLRWRRGQQQKTHAKRFCMENSWYEVHMQKPLPILSGSRIKSEEAPWKDSLWEG